MQDLSCEAGPHWNGDICKSRTLQNLHSPVKMSKDRNQYEPRHILRRGSQNLDIPVAVGQVPQDLGRARDFMTTRYLYRYLADNHKHSGGILPREIYLSKGQNLTKKAAVTHTNEVGVCATTWASASWSTADTQKWIQVKHQPFLSQWQSSS